MPKANRTSAPVELDEDGMEIRAVELADYTCTFEEHRADEDPAALFVGLPDDRCQCAHVGYVLAGRITYRYADHDETYEAGDAYVATPGHLPLLHAGTQLVEFSKTDELAETLGVVTKNLENLKAGV